MEKERSRLTEINTENILKLVRQILWISVVSILVIETIGNYVLWKTGSLNYNGTNIHHMLFKYLLVPTVFNCGILFGSRLLVKLLHADIYRQRYIYFIALELILLDVTYSHYQFLSVFSVLYVPIIVAALFEDRKLHNFVTIISLLAAIPGMAARIANPDYTLSTLPEIGICYAGILVISVISVCLTRYLAYRTRQMEEVIDEAERANRAKGDFLANMSHEIRTPMNAVVGMCELILREPDISPTVRDYCRDIQSSGRSLLAIINDILDFSKIESGKLELIEAEFNIASVLNDVINMAVARKGDKRLEIIVHADGSIPRGLIGDEQRIRQIIINLLTNAVKYTQEGCVVVRVTQARSGDDGDMIDLTVAVEDTGIGIRPEDLEKLFSSFQQVDTRKNRKVEGTGLGLSIVKRLVDLMGGTVQAASEYGKGSRFWFTIPLHIEDPSPFVAIDGMENVHVGAYVDWSKYHSERIIREYGEMAEEMRRDLHADIRLYPTMEELQEAAEKEHFTHLFTGRQEYETAADWFKAHSDGTEVVIMQDRMEAVELPEGLKCMYLPFYILSLRSVFTGDEIATNQRIGQNRYVNFAAPEARVLIVDDNEVNLKVAEGLMRPYRMHVLTAQSAKEAFAVLESRDIDLVFMDHMMPETDGVEATKLLRQRPEEYFRKLPIIALTANAVNGAKETFLDAGMNDFIAKPMELTALDRVLKTWLPKELLQRTEAEPARKAEEPATPSEPQVQTAGGVLDEALGIRYTGDEEIYRAVLEVYIHSGAEKADLLRKLYEREMWADYVIEVHALKSTSLSVGARELSERAKELELAGKAGQYEVIRERHEAAMTLYREVLDEGTAYLTAHGVDMSPPEETAETADAGTLTQMPAERVRELLEQIHNCCDTFDLDGIVALCREAEGCACGERPLGPMFEEIRVAADDFEYERADETAREIAEALKLCSIY